MPTASLALRAPLATDVPRQLLWWMGGRIVTATLLLGGTFALTVSDRQDLFGATPITLMTLVAATCAPSLGLGVWLRAGRPPERAVAIVLGCDVLVVTGVVYLTGGVVSVLTILYGAPILTGAIVHGPRAAYVVSITAIATYVGVGLALASGTVTPPPDHPAYGLDVEIGDVAYALVSNVLGLLVVSVLAGELALRLRRTGGELARAARSAAELSRLNEDVVRSVASGLLATDLGGHVRTVNPAGEEILCGSIEALEGRSVLSLLPLSEVPSGPLTHPLRGDGTGRRLDGSTFPVGFTVSSLRDAANEVRGLLVSFQDLTEINRLREAAQRAEQLAQLGRLAAGLAHEIRNPLSSISGSVELVRESPLLEAEDRRLLGIVVSEVMRLDDLVTTMLDIARPSVPRLVVVDVRSIVSDVCAVAEAGITSKSIRLARELPDTPLRCAADPGQMRQVAWNVLKNAIQASPAGATITVRAAAADAGWVVLEVFDQGPGIEPDSAARLFEMFYSGRTHGVGIGLALVKQIVDAHAGTIEAENRPEGGAVFRVRIPADGPSRARASGA